MCINRNLYTTILLEGNLNKFVSSKFKKWINEAQNVSLIVYEHREELTFRHSSTSTMAFHVYLINTANKLPYLADTINQILKTIKTLKINSSNSVQNVLSFKTCTKIKFWERKKKYIYICHTSKNATIISNIYLHLFR